jgi:VCBS repeat-containing protein
VLANDSDPDGDALSISAVGAAGHGSASVTSGQIHYVPAPGYSGADSLSYQACDPSDACSADTTVSITVTHVNHTPTAPTGTSYSTPQDTELTGQVPATDPDDDSLTFDTVTGPTHGMLTLNPDGTFSYTPSSGYVGSDGFTYQACDPSAACVQRTVALAILHTNHAPVANAGTVIMDEDTGAGIGAATADPDDDPLTLTVATPAAHGTATVGGGILHYVPERDYTGPDAFDYQVCDPSDACATATITVTVRPVNDPPTASDTTSALAEDTAADIDVLSHAADVDDDPLDLYLTSPPAHGTASIVGDAVHYLPDPDYHGGDSVDYQACDPSGACADATLTLTITPVNDPPAAHDDLVPVTGDSFSTFDPRINDSDVDGDALAVTVVADPAHGSATVEPDGTITYTPDSGYVGADLLTYRVCDPGDACDSADVTVDVTQPNRPPVVPDLADQTVDGGDPVSLDASDATDPDGDPLSYQWLQTGGPAVELTGADGPVATFTAPTGPAELTFTVLVSDGTLTATVELTVHVTAPPAPSCTDLGVTSTAAGVRIALDCVGTTGVPVQLTVVAPPGHGRVARGPDGSLSYIPLAGFVGRDAFAVQVCTPEGCTTAIVAVIVLAGAAPGGLPVTGLPVGVLVPWAVAVAVAGLVLQLAARRCRRC